VTISWLEALKNLGADITQEEKEIDRNVPSSSSAELSESLTQQGDKSAKREEEGLLALLSPLHIRHSESRASRQGCQEKDVSTKGDHD
jgi:hypothetical protein